MQFWRKKIALTIIHIALSFALCSFIAVLFFPKLHSPPCNYEPKQSPVLVMRTLVFRLGVDSAFNILGEKCPCLLSGLECIGVCFCELNVKSEQETSDELDFNIQHKNSSVVLLLLQDVAAHQATNHSVIYFYKMLQHTKPPTIQRFTFTRCCSTPGHQPFSDLHLQDAAAHQATNHSVIYFYKMLQHTRPPTIQRFTFTRCCSTPGHQPFSDLLLQDAAAHQATNHSVIYCRHTN